VRRQGRILDDLNGGRDAQAEAAWRELRAWARHQGIGKAMRTARHSYDR
jgi:hypothetical protein